MVKNLPAMQETQIQSLGWEDPLEKELTTPSSILAWKIPWTEEPGMLQSMGSQSWARLSIHIIVLCLIFFLISILFATMAAPFTAPPSVLGLPFLHILANICYLCSFLMIASLTHMRRYLIVALICISLKIHDVEHLCMYLQQLLL